MAQDYRSLDTFPAIKTFAINGTTCVQVLIPNDCNQVTVASESHKFYVGQQGQTDGQPLTDDKYFVTQNEKVLLKIGKGRNRARSLFFESNSSSDTLVIVMEEII
jgi:ribosomal protein L31